MGLLATWEKLLLGVIGLLVLLWFSPAVKTMIAQSRDAQKKLACRTHPYGSGHHFSYSFTQSGLTTALHYFSSR